MYCERFLWKLLHSFIAGGYFQAYLLNYITTLKLFCGVSAPSFCLFMLWPYEIMDGEKSISNTSSELERQQEPLAVNSKIFKSMEKLCPFDADFKG